MPDDPDLSTSTDTAARSTQAERTDEAFRRAGPGHPPIGPVFPVLAAPAELHARVAAFQEGEGHKKRAQALRDLIEAGLAAKGY